MFKRFELHNHTIESDGGITCRELIDVMLAEGVDCFAITDHNTTSGQTIIKKILSEEKLPIQCAYGMEYTTYYGHIVCPVLETYVPWDSINRHNPEELFRACKKADAVTGVAHPFSDGAPYARGCRFDMKITDFSDVDYIEIINNPEPLHDVNEPGIAWWESLVLSGERIAAGAGMDLHDKRSMAMNYATYIEGEEGGDCTAELRAAMGCQRTWVSNGILLLWTIENNEVRFELKDMNKPGFVPSERYIMTLKNANETREYDITSGTVVVPLSEMSDIEIPKLYGGEAVIEKLICVSPVIRK